MTTFMDKDFLLNTETARKLYHDYAASCPIIDYHCHINPLEIAEDVQFENIHFADSLLTLSYRIANR